MNAIKGAVRTLAACLILVLAAAEAFAYRLPECRVSEEEKATAAEDILSRYMAKLDDLSKTVSLIRLKDHGRDRKVRLTSSERRAAKEHEKLLTKIGFWEQVADLKGSLLAMHGTGTSALAANEADDIAKSVVETLYTLSQKWKSGGSALFNNFLINLGTKERGFCYHYVAWLRDPLLKRDWKFFDIRWGTAWEDTFRENNALVVTAKGRPFEEGLAVDAWRTAGRPFWTPVKGDRFPWVEAFNIEERYDVK